MSVKRIFSFSSGTLNRFGIGFAIGSALQQLDAAAGRFDLRARRGAHLVRADRDLPLQLAFGQYLDRTALAEIDQTVLMEHLERDLRLLEVSDVLEVDDLVFRTERVLEAALRQA